MRRPNFRMVFGGDGGDGGSVMVEENRWKHKKGF